MTKNASLRCSRDAAGKACEVAVTTCAAPVSRHCACLQGRVGKMEQNLDKTCALVLRSGFFETKWRCPQILPSCGTAPGGGTES